ncbi:MAG: DnaJ family molecular chaperone [Pseudomonadota bacterium]
MSVWSTLSAAISGVGAAGAGAFERVRSSIGGNDPQAAITMAIVALAAKMAKADGVVTMSEARRFWERFEVPPENRRAISRLFELAQQDVAGFESYAQRITNLVPENEALREDILDILYSIAAADGIIHVDEDSFLDRVASIFALDPVRVRRVRARHVAEHNDPYEVLGIPPDSSDSEVRTRYVTLVREHHPDSLISRGVPEEFVKVATERMAAVNAAYESIRLQRS